MKLLYAILAILSFAPLSYCQNTLEQLILDKVNHLRDSLHLNHLQLDATLNKAGEDQAYYMANKGELTHFQLTYTKETPSDRVYYYKGNRTYVGENVAQINAKLNRIRVLDIEQAANDFYHAWFSSPKHYENMIHPDYTKMGLGTWKTAKNKMYGAQVFSSDEIKLPSAFKNSELAWGVRTAEKTCKDEPQTYESMFFANSVIVEGNSVYFYFHDRNFFENVIQNDNDGMAIDVILRQQLPCNKENQFHISPVFDGEMQRPIYKNDLYRNNLSENPKKIKVKIGEVPDYLQNQQWEANIIIINDNKLCEYSYPVEVPSDIFPLFKIDSYFEVDDSLNFKKPLEIAIKDSIHLVLDYERSNRQFSSLNIEEYGRFFIWGNFVKDIEIECFASVEGPLWLNQQLLEERKSTVVQLLQSANIETRKAQFTLEENWPLMNEQIEQYSLNQLKTKTQDQVKYSLQNHPIPEQDSLLFEQRKTHVYAVIDTLVKVEDYQSFKFARYYDSTILINKLPWNKILREDYILINNPIETDLVDTLISFKKLRTNLLGAASIDGSYENLDSALVEKLVQNIDTKNAIQVFNYAQFLTHYWFFNFARNYETNKIANTITPEQLRALVDQIDTTLFRPTDLVRLKLNILLSGIHYNAAHNQWKLVETYFKTIADLVKLEDFSPQEAMELALFCNHFHKFDESVQILDQFHENKSLSEDGYFVLAKTSSLIRLKLKNEVYWAYMNSAKRANQRRYCKWLDSSFQIQRDEHIKKDFCKECK